MGNQETKKKGDHKRLNPAELQTYLMVTQAKLNQSRNKKVEMIKKKRREIVGTLEDGNLDIAKAKMEALIRDEDYITVYDILGPLCEILKEKVTYLLYADKCPEDLRATLDTVIYAATRLELDELFRVRAMVNYMYGEVYTSKVNSNTDSLVNVNVVEKLKVKPVADQYLVARLKQLCKDEKINFEFPGDYVAPIMTSFEPIQNQGQFGNNNGNNFNQNQNNFQNYNPHQQQNFNNQNTQPQFNQNPNYNLNNQNFNNMPPQNMHNINQNQNQNISNQQGFQSYPTMNPYGQGSGQQYPTMNNNQPQNMQINQNMNQNHNQNNQHFQQNFNNTGGFNPNNNTQGFPTMESVIVTNTDIHQYPGLQNNMHQDIHHTNIPCNDHLSTVNEIGSSYVSSSNSSVNAVHQSNNNLNNYSNSANNFKPNNQNLDANTENNVNFSQSSQDFRGSNPVEKKNSIHSRTYTNENNFSVPNTDDINSFPTINTPFPSTNNNPMGQSVNDNSFPSAQGQMGFPTIGGGSNEFPSTKDNSFPKTPGQ